MSEDLKEMRNQDDKKNWDPSYHYEEITSGSLNSYGIWDIPGSEYMISMWPTFYRYVSVTAVLFVVDGMETDGSMIAKTKRLMNVLLNEDELRQAAFILIVNIAQDSTDSGALSKKERERENQGMKDEIEDKEHMITSTMAELLGADVIKQQAWNAPRFRCYGMNCAQLDGPSNKVWSKIVEDIYKIYITFGPGYHA